MRLESLTQYDDRTAKSILAAASLRQNGAPFISGDGEKYRAQVDELLKEVRGHLGIETGDPQAYEKIGKFLSRQVTSEIMGNVDISSVKAKLGAKGQLPLSAYGIAFEDRALQEFKENAKFVESAIRNADEVQHIGEPFLDDKITAGVSLFLKRIDRKGKVGYWLLVEAARLADKLRVGGILRCYDDAIDMKNLSSPLGMLKSFVEIYGMPISIGNIVAEVIFIEDLQLPFGFPTDERKIDRGGDAKINFRYREIGRKIVLNNNEEDEVPILADTRILIAYAVNLSKYRNDKLLRA